MPVATVLKLIVVDGISAISASSTLKNCAVRFRTSSMRRVVGSSLWNAPK